MRRECIPTRRQFLGNSLATFIGLSTGALADAFRPVEAATMPANASLRSRVVVARSPTLPAPGARSPSDHFSLNSVEIAQLLDVAVHALFGTKDPHPAWSTIVHPGERVGIKVNTLGGRGLSTNVHLVQAICARLRQAGVKARDIVIWDRDSDELHRAGFPVRIGGDQVQCFGTDRVGFEEGLAAFGSVGSQLSKILTRWCDVLINVPVLKDHDGAGVSIALKNMYGAIHNPNRYHPNGCNPYVADVNMLPDLRSRLRLHICDATTACYEGGPAFKPEFAWKADTLLVSRDPVALDTVGWQLIERKRAAEGLKALAAEGRAPHYIETAADQEHQLGIHDLRRIELIETHGV